MRLSEVAESIEYIALETKEACMIPDAGNVRARIDGNRIFVIPYESDIKVFDISGQYLFDLGSYGQGPGEYKYVKVLTDCTAEIVWILDTAQKKLIKYRFDGTFLHESKVGPFVCRIVLLDNSQLVALNLPPREQAEEASIQYLDQNGIITKEVPLYDGFKPGAGAIWAIALSLGVVDDELHFIEPPFREVVGFNGKNEWTKLWSINQGKETASDEDYFDLNSGLWTTTYIGQIWETNQFFFIGGMHERTSRYFVYDKTSGKIRASRVLAETTNTRDMYGLMNDLDGGLPSWPMGSAGENKYLEIHNAQRFIDLAHGEITYYYEKQTTPVTEKLRDLCKKLDPEDNPVVVVVRLKAKSKNRDK